MAGIHTEKESKKMSGFYSYHFSIMDKTLVVTYTSQGGDSQKPRVIAKNVKGYEEARAKAKKHLDKAARMFEIRGEDVPQAFYP